MRHFRAIAKPGKAYLSDTKIWHNVMVNQLIVSLRMA